MTELNSNLFIRSKPKKEHGYESKKLTFFKMSQIWVDMDFFFFFLGGGVSDLFFVNDKIVILFWPIFSLFTKVILN